MKGDGILVTRILFEYHALTYLTDRVHHVKTPYIPVSWGELFDKISILLIKQQRVVDEQSKQYINHELAALHSAITPEMLSEEVMLTFRRLTAVNLLLWNIENAKRQHEREQRFDDAFIDLARQVYLRNDERAALKRQLNALLDSEIVEVKAHEPTALLAVV